MLTKEDILEQEHKMIYSQLLWETFDDEKLSQTMLHYVAGIHDFAQHLLETLDKLDKQ